MSSAVLTGVLVAGGLYLVLRPGPVWVAFGFVLLGHAANVLLLAAGGMARRGLPHSGRAADPLPQAFVLTGIVITFAVTVLLLVLAGRGDGGPDT